MDGDPIANINLIADPAKNFVLIMKDGTVYKNSLGRYLSIRSGWAVRRFSGTGRKGRLATTATSLMPDCVILLGREAASAKGKIGQERTLAPVQ